MDTLFLQGLKFPATIGIHAWEQALPQLLEIDLEIDYDTRLAAHSDQVGDALDYALLSERLRVWVADSRAQLLETLAEQLAQRLMEEFRVQRVVLRLVKPAIVQTQARVGIRIERYRNGG